MPSYDVIITGARVAGATLAIHLAQAGARVLLIDKAIFPSDVISSAFLWPPTLSHLAQIGVITKVQHGLPELRSWLKFSDGLAVQGIPPWLGSFSYNLAPMRIHFDHILLDRALSTSFVELWSPARVESLLYKGNRVVGVMARKGRLVCQAHADWIIGADGRHSLVARLANAQTLYAYPPYRAWFVAYITDWGGKPDQIVAGMQGENWIGVTPTYDELAIASMSVPITALSGFRHRVLQEFSARMRQNSFITERMNQAQVVGRVRGVVDLGGWLKQSFGEGWALVGDASAHMDPIAATGIGFSLIGAQRLARTLLTNSGTETIMQLNAYQQECNTLYRPIFEETSTPPPANPAKKHDWWYRAVNDPTFAEQHFTNMVQATMASFPEN